LKERDMKLKKEEGDVKRRQLENEAKEIELME
jgi:hypothetical protein